jgi:hypothetical protein
LSAIPIAISQARKHSAANQIHNPSSGGPSSSQNSADSSDADTDEGTAPPSRRSFGAAIGYLALLGLASPFLELQDPIHGVLGLIILSVGIRIAWRLTAGSDLQIFGLFENSAAPAKA